MVLLNGAEYLTLERGTYGAQVKHAGGKGRPMWVCRLGAQGWTLEGAAREAGAGSTPSKGISVGWKNVPTLLGTPGDQGARDYHGAIVTPLGGRAVRASVFKPGRPTGPWGWTAGHGLWMSNGKGSGGEI